MFDHYQLFYRAIGVIVDVGGVIESFQAKETERKDLDYEDAPVLEKHVGIPGNISKAFQV